MLLAGGLVPDNAADFEAVFNGIHRLQAVFAKSYIDLRNLEAVFVAFEMARLLERLPGDPKIVERLPTALRQVIVTTLEESISFPGSSDRCSIDPPAAYKLFADFIRKIHADRGECPSVITFNYDCALDYALRCASLSIDYGTGQQAHRNAVKLL